jgi:hypothetical protein
VTLDVLKERGGESEREGERARRSRGESRWKKAFHVEPLSGKALGCPVTKLWVNRWESTLERRGQAGQRERERERYAIECLLHFLIDK